MRSTINRPKSISSKLFLLAGLLLPSFAIATPTTCPDPGAIQRAPGIYSWSTTLPGWEGYFSAPQEAKGYSNKIKRFVQARWIQFSNLPNSPGYIQCDYAGDIGEETIRFAQINNKATIRPDSEFWAHVENLQFPSVQRTCAYTVELCTFEQL